MKRGVKLLFISILLCLTVCALAACNFDFGNSSNSNQSGNSEQTEKKITFAEAEENYAKKDVKRADSTAYLGVTFYLAPLSSNSEEAFEKHTLSAVADTKRLASEEATYADLNLKPGDEVSDSVIGLLSVVKQALSGDKNDIIMGNLDEDVKSALKEMASFVEYMQGFLQEKVDLYARAGRRDGVTNFKAGYAYRKTDEETEKGEGWYSVGDDFIKSIFGFDPATTNFADGLYPAAFFDVTKGKDEAPERVDKSGSAAYDVRYNADGIRNFIDLFSEKLWEALEGTELGKDGKNAIDGIADKFASWLDEEKSASRFAATVGADKLPKKTRAETALVFNINVNELRSGIIALKNNGVVDEKTADTLNYVLYMLSLYTRGTNGEKGSIGLELNFYAEETYSYAAKDCSVDGIDDDMFISDDEDGERLKIEDYFKKLTEIEAEKFLADAFESLGTESEEITAAVREKLGSLDGVTLAELKKTAFVTLGEYITDDEGIKEIIAQIKKELFS